MKPDILSKESVSGGCEKLRKDTASHRKRNPQWDRAVFGIFLAILQYYEHIHGGQSRNSEGVSIPSARYAAMP